MGVRLSTHCGHSSAVRFLPIADIAARAMLDVVDTLITVAWFVWAIACASATRVFVVRWAKGRIGLKGAYVTAYSVLLVGLIATLLLVSWSGMQAYGFNRRDPWQMAGYISLFISPLGLPVLFGGPVIFLVDMFRLWRGSLS